MKSLFTGFMLLVLGVLIAPVSFASDGPPTTKVCYIMDDIDHPVSFDFVTVEFDKSGSVCVIDVGKTEFNTYTPLTEINQFGLPGYFVFNIESATKHPPLNEWLMYKNELERLPLTSMLFYTTFRLGAPKVLC